jgi:hypothetical protein
MRMKYFLMTGSVVWLSVACAVSVFGSEEKSRSESFVFTAAGDFGARASTSAVLDGIAGSGSEFHLALGDMSYNGIQPESSWCRYVRSHVGENFPFAIISGNHEQDGPHGKIGNFSKDLPDRLKSKGKYGKEYYFDYPQVTPLARFILISPSLNFKFSAKYLYKKGDKHYAWLARVIDEARSEGIPWIIVGMHLNYISTGRKESEIGEDVFNLLIDKKVDLILQGHDHNYQRSKAFAVTQECPSVQPGTFNPDCVSDSGSDGIYEKGLGPVLVIIGTGGESIYQTNPNDLEAPYFAKLIGDPSDPTYGFARFTITRDTLAEEFIPCHKVKPAPEHTDKFLIRDMS